MNKTAIKNLQEYKDIFCCPNCKKDLNFCEASVECKHCQQNYEFIDNIPIFLWPRDTKATAEVVRGKVKEFYEENPFPNYDDLDNIGSLIKRAKQGLFARLLDEQVPFGARILEAGCGTGQLSNF